MNSNGLKQTIFSGIQPSGLITLGNYLGAVKNWVQLQDDYDCVYCIVDMHAITVRQDAETLLKNTLEAFALIMACGISPEKSTMFIQSHVAAHAELSWLLGSYALFGELSRMTQFKDKSQRYADNINGALFTYPVLMAADILLYNTDLVPVGADQKQHVELTRDIAIRFNGIYGDTFKTPDVYTPKVGARIMSLLEPGKKMSKSDPNPNGYVAVLDSPDVIQKKFKRAVTDSGGEIKYGEGKEGINNLLSIYSVITGKDIPTIEVEFDGKGYGAFKSAVGEVVADALRPVRERYNELMADTAYLRDCYTKGAEKAREKADPLLHEVKKKIGFITL